MEREKADGGRKERKKQNALLARVRGPGRRTRRATLARPVHGLHDRLNRQRRGQAVERVGQGDRTRADSGGWAVSGAGQVDGRAAAAGLGLGGQGKGHAGRGRRVNGQVQGNVGAAVGLRRQGADGRLERQGSRGRGAAWDGGSGRWRSG